MKRIYFLFTIVLAMLITVVACEKDSIEVDELQVIELEDITSAKPGAEKTVTLGFNLVFTGTYIYQGPDAGKCGVFDPVENPLLNVVNQGEGTGTHFGKFTTHFDFCVDISDSSYPNGFVDSYLEDEDGDRLYVAIEGFVLPGRVPGMPSFATSYFKDPILITGGTGKFEGASGNGMTNDYNSSKDPYSHHHWQGKITLVK